MDITYPNGCKKAFTMSYDDGIEQDKRFIEIINRYSLKATFNINYGLLDESGYWETEGVKVKRLESKELQSLYQGHEIACHGLTHSNIVDEVYAEKEQQIIEDKKQLEKLLGKEIYGMAYPFGTVDDDMINIMKENGLEYGRVVEATHDFQLPTDFYKIQPTAHHNDANMYSLIEEYKALDDGKLSVFYLFGHAYEFDVNNNWEHLEEICKKISMRSDIWYCTNEELIRFLHTIN